MEKKFRFYDPFNDCYSYSDRYDNLARFFSDYQLSLEGENRPILEQWTGLHDSTTWQELSEERQKEWLSKDFAPSSWAGIPIFENDVIKSDNHWIKHKLVFDIGDRGGIAAEFIPYCEINPNCPAYQGWIDEFSKKVIGSATSNPELLEKEK